MKRILTEKELDNCLNTYYREHYGEYDTDEWYEKPALNVCVFERDGKIITLKCHILSGRVTEQVEEK